MCYTFLDENHYARCSLFYIVSFLFLISSTNLRSSQPQQMKNRIRWKSFFERFCSHLIGTGSWSRLCAANWITNSRFSATNALLGEKELKIRLRVRFNWISVFQVPRCLFAPSRHQRSEWYAQNYILYFKLIHNSSSKRLRIREMIIDKRISHSADDKWGPIRIVRDHMEQQKLVFTCHQRCEWNCVSITLTRIREQNLALLSRQVVDQLGIYITSDMLLPTRSNPRSLRYTVYIVLSNTYFRTSNRTVILLVVKKVYEYSSFLFEKRTEVIFSLLQFRLFNLNDWKTSIFLDPTDWNVEKPSEFSLTLFDTWKKQIQAD